MKKLEINKEKFIGKPLITLLKEIKPSIEYIIGAPGEGVRPNAFLFYFIPQKEYDKYRKKGKFPLTLRVFVKEDEAKYGSLTINKIEVAHENEKIG